MKRKVYIFIASEQKGFLISLAKILEADYNSEICIVARDKYVKKLIDRLLPGRNGDIVLSEIIYQLPQSEVMSNALEIEKKYKINLSMLMSEDRALGQGHLHNIEKIPDIVRASWGNKDKLKEIIEIIRVKEIIIQPCDFVIQLTPDKITSMVARYLGAGVYCPASIKFGDRILWCDDDFATSSRFVKRVKDNLNLNHNNQYGEEYKVDADGDRINLTSKFKYRLSLIQAAKIFLNETKNYIRGIHKKNAYHYLGWVPTVFRKVRNYRYLESISITPDQVKEYKIVFFPLHLEPEIALLNYSPEFSNSMEVISWISKALPSDAILVVKEQVGCFGVRSKWYYNHINKIGNVVWANPTTHSWDWIRSSEAIATITGTVAIEAVHMKKPVISYGKHQITNHLPTVHYVSNFEETKVILNRLLSTQLDKIDLEKSRFSLYKAQIETSVDLPEYKDAHISVKLEDAMAEKALKLLYEEYIKE